MTRPRRLFAHALLLFSTALVSADDEKKGEKWLIDREMTVSPAAAPVPSLRHRLYPSSFDRKEGTAVPLYLRFAHEKTDAWRKALKEKPEEWNKLPPDKLPLAEVKKYLAGHRYNFRQLELGA